MQAGARRIDVPQFTDPRGRLAAFEHDRPLPFKPVRTFVITDVPAGAERAGHVARCDEFLWMAAGACRVRVSPVESEDVEADIQLEANGPGFYVPQGTWLVLSDFAPGSVLICLAAADYVART